jgi:hypothetical protein
MSGGLMLAALAAVWFLMFLPSWMSRTNEREKSREDRTAVKQTLAEELSSLPKTEQQKAAGVATRALRLKRLTLFIALPAIAVLSWSLAILATNPEVLLWAIGSAVVVAVAIVLNRVANTAYLRALDSSRVSRSRAAQRRANVALPERISPATNSEAKVVDKDPRAWSAPGLPRPLYKGSEGSIEQVTFAEVVELKTSTSEESVAKTEQLLSGTSLDEIMKRRRANG